MLSIIRYRIVQCGHVMKGACMINKPGEQIITNTLCYCYSATPSVKSLLDCCTQAATLYIHYLQLLYNDWMTSQCGLLSKFTYRYETIRYAGDWFDESLGILLTGLPLSLRSKLARLESRFLFAFCNGRTISSILLVNIHEEQQRISMPIMNQYTDVRTCIFNQLKKQQ